MRVDQLQFEYDEELFSYVSGLDDLDIVIQPVDSGFIAEVVDGTSIHKLGNFVSDRWAKMSALEKAKEILKARGESALATFIESFDEEGRKAVLVMLDMLGTLPVVWRHSEAKNPAASGR